jgi:uncharacterized 2Fe-2S/4Fe-4S cluster protein (DUF4445 family)
LGYLSSKPFGIAIDIGTTSVVLYFLNLLNGEIEKISSFLNLQKLYGADIITRINYCKEHEDGLSELQKSIVDAINYELNAFRIRKGYSTGLNINADAEDITLPCVSAFLGADILAGLAALKVPQRNYLFLDVGKMGK